jgi:hypothetical protein
LPRALPQASAAGGRRLGVNALWDKAIVLFQTFQIEVQVHKKDRLAT